MNKKPTFELIRSYFSADSFLKNATAAEVGAVRAKQNAATWVKLHMAAFVFLSVNVFFVISDLITGFYSKHAYSYLNISAEVIFILSALLLLLVLHLIRDRSGREIPIIQFVYYLIVETGILFYFAADLLRSNLAGGSNNVSNSFYNMIVLVIFVAYSFKFVAILAGYIFGVGVVLIAMLQNNFIWANYQLLFVLFILFFLCANYFRANNTKYVLSIVRLENVQGKLEKLSTRDFLTKLSNRTALNSFVKHELSHAIGEGKAVSLLMLDIDDFKAYNDYYSHMAGDKCLHDIAEVMLKLENIKFEAFRYGGEEFLIIGIDADEAELQEHAANIIKGVHRLAVLREDGMNSSDIVTVSIGLALSMSVETSDFASLMMRADKELYRAKRAGKNCYFFRGKKYTV